MQPSLARRFHAVLEPIAATIFFAPEATEEYAALGLDPVQGYVCSRAAPMGRVSPETVAAVFYSFSTGMIREALRWDIAEPHALLAARSRAARAALARLLASDEGEPPALGEVVAALRDAVAACAFEGRPLAAAHAGLPWPGDEVTALWHAATVLREYRGDGHVAALVTHGIDGAQALALDAAFSAKPAAYYEFRRFDRAERDRASGALIRRGYLATGGTLTEGGAKFRGMIEAETDRLAAPPFDALDPARRDAALGALVPLVARICERKGVPRFLRSLFESVHPV